MLCYKARSRARPSTVWPLLAQPRHFCRWAPLVRGASGLGDPEVQEGAEGTVRFAGLLPVHMRIVEKRPGRAWTAAVGSVRLVHRVQKDAQGSLITLEIHAPIALEAAVALMYGSALPLMVRRLARMAERREAISSDRAGARAQGVPA